MGYRPFFSLLCALWFTGGSVSLQAQSTPEYGVTLLAGYARPSRMNQVMGAFLPEGYPSVPADFVCLGVEGYTRDRRLLIGLEATSLLAPSAGSKMYRVNRSVYRGQLKFGYMLLERSRWRLLPTVGQGVSVFRLLVRPAGTAPGPWVLLNHTTDLACQLSRRLTQGGRNSLWGGLRAGYLWSTPSSLWHGPQPTPPCQVATGRPTYRLDGFYLSLTVTFSRAGKW